MQYYICKITQIWYTHEENVFLSLISTDLFFLAALAALYLPYKTKRQKHKKTKKQNNKKKKRKKEEKKKEKIDEKTNRQKTTIKTKLKTKR